MTPRRALVRTLLATAAVLLLVGVAVTAEAPRAPWLVWLLVALGAAQALREAIRYARLRRE